MKNHGPEFDERDDRCGCLGAGCAMLGCACMILGAAVMVTFLLKLFKLMAA